MQAIQFNHRLVLFTKKLEEPSYLIHLQSDQQAEFIGKRWNRYEKGRCWKLKDADYEQSKAYLTKVRFLWKGELKRIIWVENIIFARMIKEWFKRGNSKVGNLPSNWEVKFDDPSAAPLKPYAVVPAKMSCAGCPYLDDVPF